MATPVVPAEGVKSPKMRDCTLQTTVGKPSQQLSACWMRSAGGSPFGAEKGSVPALASSQPRTRGEECDGAPRRPWSPVPPT